MLNYKFHPTLIVRSPVYNHSFYTDQNLSEVLKQSFFRKAIYFSSEVFYNELQKLDFDISKLDKKAVDTLKKYFNRMCFRPTPFGISSAFGAAFWGDYQTNIEFSNHNLRPSIQFSYAKSIAYANKLLDNYDNSLSYKVTSAIYKTGKEYRFIRSNHDNAQTEFLIDSIKANPFFDKLLKFLSVGHTYPQIVNYLCQQTNCTVIEANQYAQWLIESQIITHSSEANITGDDYLSILLNKYNSPNIIDAHIPFKTISDINSIDDLDNIPDKENGLNSNDFYVNLKVDLPDSHLSTNYQQDIIDGLHCLDYLTTTSSPPVLADFIKAFTHKFDGQTIPLLKALDPEVGVGYGNLAEDEENFNIAKNIMGGSGADTPSIKWTDVHALLLMKWKNDTNFKGTIVLTDDDLKQLKKHDQLFPNSTSVMFRIVEDKILIETAGGVCASALAGRFTPFDERIHQLTIDMACKESQSNPNIIFAEIAHICHDKTANIDRRKHIYTFEISVLVQSTMPAEQQITLDDIWVSVVNRQIILQSKKYGKRVIPRLSSAFNYNRNDLAVFRFLCDMQKASLKTNWSLNFGSFFPGLTYYPRVEYKNAILYLAQWTIKKETIDRIWESGETNKTVLFNKIKADLNLPNLIALTQHDHQLIFNLQIEADIVFFLDCIKTQNQVTVKEYLLPATNQPVLVNKNGQLYVNQFIASLYHDQQIYKPITTPIITAKTNQRKFIPGSEWLYFKLYCHSVRSNEILVNCIGGILKKLQNQKLIIEWFFIRYLDPDYHIRLRLKITTENYQYVSSIVSTTISKYIHNETISNYSVNIYEREMERYSHLYMNDFEHVFCTSSNLVLMFYKQCEFISATNILEFAVASTYDILVNLGIKGPVLIKFLEQTSDAFINEFNSTNDLKYQLDIEFRKQKYNIELVMKNADGYYNNLKLKMPRAKYLKSLTELKYTIEQKSAWKQKLVSDIIHMHLNRVFVNDSRRQEMAIYYFLLKYERSAQARLTKMKNAIN